jgi:transcriptional regulator with XRE-family HTH domain
MSLGSYLREIRDSQGLTLREVEKLAKDNKVGAEISSGYLSMLERDEVKEPSPRILFALASIYGKDYIDLMKRAGYIPKDVKLAPHTPAQVAFRGANRLSKEQKERIQHIVDLELRDALRSKRKHSEQ